mmetsp:Transcript_6977/g.6509  ORF Transcript_6977/g.6509 Transcript_6977/m.6509 type:complete len:436 (-) Transcript_6977:458-1765(-)
MEVVDATQHHAHHHRSHRRRGKHHEGKENAHKDEGHEDRRLKDHLPHRNRTKNKVKELIEDLDTKTTVNLQSYQSGYYYTDPNNDDYHQSYSSNDSVFGKLDSSFYGDWADEDGYQTETVEEDYITYAPTTKCATSYTAQDEGYIAYEKPLSSISNQVVFENQDSGFYSKAYVDTPTVETTRKVIVEMPYDSTQREYTTNQYYTDQYATNNYAQVQYVTQPSRDYVIERHVSREEPKIQTSHNVVYEHERYPSDNYVTSDYHVSDDHMRKVIVEEVPAPRTQRVVVGEPLPSLQKQVVVEQPVQIKEEVTVDQPVKIIHDVVTDNVFSANPDTEYTTQAPEIQYIREDPTWIHDVKLTRNEEVASCGAAAVAAPAVVDTPVVVAAPAETQAAVSAPIHFAQKEEAIDSTSYTGGFPWWLFPIIFFAIASLILLYC